MRRNNFLIALLEDYSEDKIGIMSDDARIMEGIKPAFGSPGGKFFVAGKLVAMFPEYDTYVESFIGGGSVLFRKEKTSKEFINDRDGEIFFCFKFMQDLDESQLALLEKKNWTTDKNIFNQLLQSYRESPEMSDPIQRFYRIVYLKAASDAGEMRSYDDRAQGEVMKLTTRLMSIKERLSGVTICNMDYRDFVKKYANESSFTFLDPPYPSAKMNWKWCPTQEEFESFTKTIPGKWMVTYEVCDGWKESKYCRKILSQYNLAAPAAGHMTRKSELVVTNYPMKANSASLNSSFDPELEKDALAFISEADFRISESDESLEKEFKSVVKLYAAKRRGNEVKETFEQLQQSFKECLSKLIEAGHTNFKPDRMEGFARELFDKYADYKYIVPQPDGKTVEAKTLTDLKEQGIDYRGYKFEIKMKESEKQIGNFTYYKQWWKSKVSESIALQDFVVSTDLGFSLRLNSDILAESFKESVFYIKPEKKEQARVSASIEFVQPLTESNKTTMPSWIKKIDEGKMSILSESETEKIIEFSGEKLKNIYVAKRQQESSDFWTIMLKA